MSLDVGCGLGPAYLVCCVRHTVLRRQTHQTLRHLQSSGVARARCIQTKTVHARAFLASGCVEPEASGSSWRASARGDSTPTQTSLRRCTSDYIMLALRPLQGMPVFVVLWARNVQLHEAALGADTRERVGVALR